MRAHVDMAPKRRRFVTEGIAKARRQRTERRDAQEKARDSAHDCDAPVRTPQ